MPKIQAIIFDMDGVLVDAKDWHYQAFNLALNKFGYNVNKDEHDLKFDGLPTKEKLKILSKEKGLSKELYSKINELKQEYTVEQINLKCCPTKEQQETFLKLKNDNYIMAVASNSIKNTVDLVLKKTNLQQYLTFSLSNQDVVYPKPNPEIYNIAIKKLNLNPKQCLILEDNPNGIKAAIKSGAFLLKIDSIEDVNYYNIKNRINEIEKND